MLRKRGAIALRRVGAHSDGAVNESNFLCVRSRRLCGAPLFLRRGRLLTDLLEVVLHVALHCHWHFIAIDLGPALRMLRAALCVRRPDLLAGGFYLHRGLARHRLRPLADNLADLAHRRQLFGLLDALVAVLAAHSAARLIARLLRVVFAGAFTIGILRVVGLIARLTFLRIALLSVLLLPVL